MPGVVASVLLHLIPVLADCQGAVVIYKNVLAPFLLNHQETVDRALNDVTRTSTRLTETATAAAATAVREQVAAAVVRRWSCGRMAG